MSLNLLKNTPTSITVDSRSVRAGSLFLAYPGAHSDGRQYIADAIQNGATAVFWAPEGFVWNPDWQVENVPVTNLRAQAGLIADTFYRQPSQHLWMIGVTGTNGKTSITHWLSQCFNQLARKAAVIGTLGNGFAGALSATQNTTPDAVLLHGMLADYLQQGARVVAMEVSSHGLDQGRVNGVQFDVAVLSNLTRDHLDYHKTPEAYAAAKRKLFVSKGLKTAVLNVDDAFGKALQQELMKAGAKVISYGIKSGEVRASNIQLNANSLMFEVNTPYGKSAVQANLIGQFNVYNVLAVLATLLVSGVTLQDAVRAIAQIESAPGRMQQMGGDALPLVVVDYAHTPDALHNVLTTLRKQTVGKLICVFGCGGNRDAGKRPLMGKTVSETADLAVVTSDNPRDEDPESILQAILEGMEGSYAIELDRAKAIQVAIENASPKDTVLIAGKGHEDYQEIKGKKLHFSDVEQAQAALKRKREVLA